MNLTPLDLILQSHHALASVFPSANTGGFIVLLMLIWSFRLHDGEAQCGKYKYFRRAH